MGKEINMTILKTELNRLQNTINFDFLYKEYIINKRSSHYIAHLVNCSHGYILKKLRENKIQLREQNKKTTVQCSNCNKNFDIQPYRLVIKQNLFCSKKCFKEYRSSHNCSKRSETRIKMSISAKRRGRQTHQDGRTFKPYTCKECGRKIHFDTALYGHGYCRFCVKKGERHPNFGKCILIKFCFYKNTWFKSSWEANFAKWCDLSGIKWEYESKSFRLNINNKTTNYIPDFYLSEFDCYIEIKGYWRDDAKLKFEETRQKYTEDFKLFEKDDLKILGVI